MQGEKTLTCLQLNMTEEEALLWLIRKHHRSTIINDFSRILLALELEPWFKVRARSSQQVGGQRKASSNLTQAEKLDVRSEIAHAAGASDGNVSKVKRLLQEGIPEVLEALRLGEVSIHRASVWVQDDPDKQHAKLDLHRNLRGITKRIGSLLRAHRCRRATGEQLDLQRIANALATMPEEQKTIVLVSEVSVPGYALLLSPRLLQALVTQEELQT
jgi:hypothetical protein